MKKKIILVASILISTAILSCTNDSEKENTFKSIEGTVQGTTSCTTEKEDLAYEIIPINSDIPVSFIITATLPEELKEEGLRIKFDMKPSSKYINYCTANFTPDHFYEVFNANILNDYQ